MPTEPSDISHRCRYTCTAAAVLVLLIGRPWSVCHAQPPPGERFEFVEAPFAKEEFGLAAELKPLSSRGNLHALVIFAQFADEAPAAVPAFATQIFDPNHPGSFTHFYTTMSFGQLQVQGTVLPKRYISDRPKKDYLVEDATEYGQYGQFALEVLQKVDGDIDLGLFDNDGPDRIPNSGDDDGRVDYVFINLLSVPKNFIIGGATGKAGLGFGTYRSTTDTAPGGKPIRVVGMLFYGTILKEGDFAQTVGSMAHEFGHSLGLPDLYDLSFQATPDQAPSRDGAGVGAWCLMGRGALGWNEDDGPNPLCAWSREQLSWVGRHNERLVEIRKDTTGLEISSLYQRGAIYKIPLEPESIDAGTFSQDYLLLEQRVKSAHYYDRHLPGEGLLVWHVRSRFSDNSREEQKLVDLVCADGLYRDAGFPSGKVPAPHDGGDNLDFWAHDQAYRVAHRGNPGDPTDLFDGVHYARLAFDSNPSTANWGQQENEAHTGLVIDLHSQGDVMIADIKLPRWEDLLEPGTEPATPEAEVPTAVLEDSTGEPMAFALLPNYPNPFDQQTTLRYTLAAPSQVQLTIYNALGQTVRLLVDDYQPLGLQKMVWDGRDKSHQDVASGVYLYRLEVPGKYVAGSKMLLLRSGFSWVSPLEATLKARGGGWTGIRRELAMPLEPAFGVAAKSSVTKAAFTTGLAWLNLSVSGQDSQEARSQVALLRALLLQFAPSPAQLQAIDTISVYLKTGSQSPELFDQGHRAVAQLFQTHSEQAAIYFYLGEWLQSLGAAVLVAQHLALPLSGTLDLSSSAAIGRQFSADLDRLQADEKTAASLDYLTTLLEAKPRSGEELRAVLELLEEIADPLTIR